MIAKRDQHIAPRQLLQLLEDSLTPSQHAETQRHLDECKHCRRVLESISGNERWWNETRQVLRESSLGHLPSHAPTERSRDESIQPASNDIETRSEQGTTDPAVDWIQPLLDPSEVGRLGELGRYP
ncbi:MAG: hypothetical protein AAGA03_07400, partial [Planctomycetota bacterium]